VRIASTSLPGVLVLEPDVLEDARGHFFEAYNRETLAAAGIHADFVQDNQSCSARNVLRGLHYQVEQVQGKLVRAIAGEIFDVAVDLRRSSHSFGRWVGHRLSSCNKHIVWVPPGFAHGFLTLSEIAEVHYKVTDYHAPRHERRLKWDDPDIGIEWPIDGPPRVSKRDAEALPLRAVDAFP
jgi:dTDP-4-dehydrorhamnose 3,5-epimerase